MPLTEEAVQEIVSAARLEPGEEARFLVWLHETDQRFLEQQREIADDMAPGWIRARLDKAAKLSTALERELRHPAVRRYLEVDCVRGQAGDVTRARAWALARELDTDIGAVSCIRDRCRTAHAHITKQSSLDQLYFGKPQAAKPDLRDLFCRAWNVWIHVLGRPRRLTGIFVAFTHTMVTRMGNNMELETVRSRLKQLAPP